MKKKAYSILIVIYAIFNVYVLSNYKDSVHVRKNIDNKIVSSDVENTIENNMKTDEEKNKEIKSEENFNKDKKEKESNNHTESNVTEENKNKSDSRLRKYRKDLKPDFEEKFEEEYKPKVKNWEDEEKQEESILKVPARDIEKKLTIIEKIKIINICKQLSKEDYSCITKYLNSDNEKEAVINTMNLLEDKLDDEEIDEVINIFSKYIDFEKLDKKY